jgi:hypothetical protein
MTETTQKKMGRPVGSGKGRPHNRRNALTQQRSGVRELSLKEVKRELAIINRAADDFFRLRGLPIPHVSKTHLEFVEGISDLA